MVGSAADSRPFVLDADVAAHLIVTRLRSRPAVIDFPLPTTLGIKLAGSMPRFVRNLVAPRITSKPR